ncbi:IS256 family transposase [Streptomyces cupreus]|uniref:Mutator family transposase n=1 Tax=Streptomyces cupreus TaxID=2759956 RepID=A0A7X1MDE4_9ACTN|nr:IS256 family transposase [Streptomyces cupreus]MBC2906893.1 IS256 family transposase [Streptomyces cupreus]
MTAPDSLPLHALAEDNLAAASPDLLRAMVKTFADALMSAEADALCNAEYGQVSDERVNHRNGYRPREWDTRAGTVELAIPKLRSGSYFPHWLLERRRRAEQALISVVATAYLLGVSTRRDEKLAESLGVTQLSKSQVSAMAQHLDEQVSAFRNRPLDQGPYAFVWVDALTQKVREGGRIINVHALIAVGVNADGHREILGLDVATAEDGAGWLAFLRSLIARGLSGVQLVISDAHMGLVNSIGATLPGAGWQRCRTHYARALPSQVPKSAQPWVATLLRTVFEQPDADAVQAQMRHVLDALEAKFPKAASHLDAAQGDVLAFTAFPRESWRQIWSNNPQERLNKVIRCRTDVVGIFPDRAALIRLVGAVPAEQNDEWTEARRYMGLDLLAKARLHPIESETDDTVLPTEPTA